MELHKRGGTKYKLSQNKAEKKENMGYKFIFRVILPAASGDKSLQVLQYLPHLVENLVLRTVPSRS
jgi:hypothetical protein